MEWEPHRDVEGGESGEACRQSVSLAARRADIVLRDNSATISVELAGPITDPCADAACAV